MSTEKKVWILILFFAGLFALGVYNVRKPDKGPIRFIRGEIRELTPEVLVGPYPTEEEIGVLKSKGVSVIVSLMNPAIPIEADIMEAERAATQRSGIDYYNFPMDFTDLKGATSIERLKAAIGYVSGMKGKKVYVHCYLGRHRVSMFEKEFKGLTGGGSAPPEKEKKAAAKL